MIKLYFLTYLFYFLKNILAIQYLRPLNSILLLSSVKNVLFHSILATLLTKRRNQRVEMEDLDGGDPQVRANGLAI